MILDLKVKMESKLQLQQRVIEDADKFINKYSWTQEWVSETVGEWSDYENW